MIKLGNWHDSIGTTHENSSNREAANKHLRGGKKYKEMIDKGSKNADRFKNLPFTFSKPPKRAQHRRDVFMICLCCSHVDVVNKYTVGKVCSKCSSYTSIGKENSFDNEDSLQEALEALHKDSEEVE